ncbi:hypothetical protein [Streptomyces sp. NPDC058280]|uniref:hypothetical protein n=1 Tax=Streptomyces sp. NPDC058280 TaxID=3346419 RepID=UPI0036E1D2AF
MAESTAPTSDDVSLIEKKLEKYGFHLKSHGPKRVMFTSEGMGRSTLREGFIIPKSIFSDLEKQLDVKVETLSDHIGLCIPSRGYFEMTVRNISNIRARTFEPVLRFLEPLEISCRHTSGSPLLSVAPFEHMEHKTSTLRDPRRVNSLHVSDVKSDVCIEISWASPCGILWGVPNGRMVSNDDYFLSTMTLKIDFGTALPVEELRAKGKSLGYSFLYELNIRNGVALEPIPLAELTRAGGRSVRPDPLPARFPTMDVQSEVAELFMFAEGARTNPSLAFLAYYQVLEYFFPFAIRRSAIKRVRKEVSDPTFNKQSDPALLRILAIAESATHASEAAQIAALISESVRQDVLADFFSEESDWGNHFTKSGPISGVEPVNLRNPQKPIFNQVAERVYGIRNRIVHAKDDPRYGDVRVLLPKSREAYALEPDIRLTRLLATEVILDSQSL